MNIANSWLQSGLPALIRGARLYPKPHPKHTHIAHGEEGAQGTAYHLYQKSTHREWILKKFHSHSQPDYTYLVSIRSLVPKNIAFATAAKRVVLTNNDLKSGDGLYCSNEFGRWLGNAILMQKSDGVSWKNIAQGIQTGEIELSMHKRIEFAKSLAHAIQLLSREGCAHRDLSHENAFFDLQEYVCYLVDWDSMFHGSLYFQKNIPAGSAGYTAPWVRGSGDKWDARRSWNKRADRFALSVLIAELLLLDAESAFHSEGALFSSEMFLIPRHPYIAQTIESLYRISEGLGDLFQQTMTASSYDECPDSVNWLEVLDDIKLEQFPAVYEEYEEESQTEGEYQGDDEYEYEYEHEHEEDDEEDDEEVYEGGYERETAAPSETVLRQLKVNWLFVAILLLPVVVFALYHYREKLDIQRYMPQFSIFSSSGPEVSSFGEPPGTAENGERYSIKIHYTDDDLEVQIGKYQYPVAKDNTVAVSLPPGRYPVTLTFTGIRFLADGAIEYTEPIKYTEEIVFDKEKVINIRVDRIDKKWTIDIQ